MDYQSILTTISGYLGDITFYVKFLLVLMIMKTFGSLYRGK